MGCVGCWKIVDQALRRITKKAGEWLVLDGELRKDIYSPFQPTSC